MLTRNFAHSLAGMLAVNNGTRLWPPDQRWQVLYGAGWSAVRDDDNRLDGLSKHSVGVVVMGGNAAEAPYPVGFPLGDWKLFL